MRNNIAFLRLVLASALCILMDLNGVAADLFLPPIDSICEGNALITTQAEWDQFAADYEGCTTFIGDITIDNSLAEIDSLYGLENLYKVIGNIEVHAEGTQITLRTFNRLDSIIGNLALSISVNLYGFQKLKYVHQFTIEDLADQSWETGEEVNGNYFRSFDSLYHCETISIINIGVIQNVLPSVFEVESVLIQAPANAAYLGETLNALSEADSIVIMGSYIVSNCFQNVISADVIDLGSNGNFIGLIQSSFEQLESVYSLVVHTAYGDGYNTFPNLISAHTILLDASPNPNDLASLEYPLLQSLQEITGDLFFALGRRNFYLPNLLHVGGSIYMMNYDFEFDTLGGLETISLPLLQTIIGNLGINGIGMYDNVQPSFISFNAPNLNYIGGMICLDGGNNLTTCICPAFCESPNYSPNWECLSGGPGCSSIEEIQAQCLGSYASGTVYYDVNCDQQFNNDDAPVSYPILLQGDTVPIGSSGADGYFFLPLELNSSSTLVAQHTADWSSDGPLTLTLGDSLQVFAGLQIGLCPVTIIHDVAVSMNASMNPRPGFTVRYNVIAQNLWPGSDSTSVAFSTAQMPGAVITGYAEGGLLAGNQVSFATNLLYGQSQTLWVDALVPVGTPLGTNYTATATIALSDPQAIDSHHENNTYTLHQTVIGSYDPNDKLVTPTVIDLLDLDSTNTEFLEYTIRFQNTGTAEAIFVRVLDTLSQALDLTSFQFIAASHPTEIIFHNDHVIEWFFDNIMLPDSFSNEPGSHGFIQFRIRTNELSAPFNLENSAAIYFDFNAPVITAPAVTQVVICAEAGSVCDDGDSCTTNDMIQADCTCLGSSNDIDNDGICDLQDNCQGVPYPATPITDLNLTCASSIPSELPEFLMADNGPVTVSFTDSVITGTGCNALIQRTYIAENACGNRVYVAQFITTEDNIAPTLLNCPADTTINSSELSGYFAQPIAIDNCADSIMITFTEESLNCTTDSTVFELYTPDILLNNACNDPYPYSLSLHMQPIQHRIFRIDTTRAATMVDYHNGTVRFSGRFVNVLNNNAGYDFNFNFINGMNFLEWTTSHPAGFNADCGASPENHADWMYYITENSPWFELQGWGEYTGSQIDIMHAPVSQYFGFQIGYGANSLETSYGGGTIYAYQGNFVLNGTTTSVFGPGNFRITIQDTTISQITRTWTATDCAGNSSSCTQIIHCINDTIDQDCSPGQSCDDNDSCTLNDVIQTDCSCLGVFTDSDGDGTCDAQDTCNEALSVLYADDDVTIDCSNELPDFMVVLSAPDGGAVDVEYRDSILFQTGCDSDILQLAIATNACGDTTIVTRIVTIEDLTPPVFTTCEQEITVTCDALGNTLSVPGVSDDCSSSIVVSYTENCLDCTTDSTVYPCATPVRPADNPCGYPHDWSLALFNLPNAHRWYHVDTTVPATMTDYHNGMVTFRGRWVNAQDNNGGFDYEFTLGQGQSWLEWSADETPHGFLADCGGVDENHPDWMYYLLQSGAGFELHGWGTYAGSLINITHAPSNQYFGHQIGLGANNYNAEYGMIGWANITGTLFVSGNPGNPISGGCDIAFVMPSCVGHTSEVTWTAIDCSGNTATCSQIVHFEPTFEEPECFVDNPCDDNDPCTIGDTYQADCSCLGSLLDNDNDGLCDLTAPCDGVIIGEPCDDLDQCTINDFTQADCTCAGTFSDNDNDGICDAEDACDNTLAGTTCDDGDACTINDLIQADCSCTGTFADADNDGICDASELAGCTDIEACNYNTLATDDDGSCVYVESLTIEGNLTAVAGVSESYYYPGPATSSYQWSITPGTIQSGQGTTTVSVIWNDAPLGTLQVTETNESACVGSTVVLEVNITPNNVTSWNDQSMVLYPNPASDELHIAGDIPSNAQVSIYNSVGQCVYTGSFSSTIDVRPFACGVYHLHVGHNGTYENVKFTIVRD